MPRKETEFKWERPGTLVETARRFPKVLGWAIAPFELLADWALYGFDRVALIRFAVQAVLAASIVGGVIALWFDLSDRPEERLLRAWKVLSDAPAGGNFGQKDAVQFIHNKGRSLQKIVLKGAPLAGIDLRGANLRGADLSAADLSAADLRKANLGGANLSAADLSVARLSGAYLSEANLSGADLSAAFLRKANLSGADLSAADLSAAILSGADLRKANLGGANLSAADLTGANLGGVKYCQTTMPDSILKAPKCKLP